MLTDMDVTHVSFPRYSKNHYVYRSSSDIEKAGPKQRHTLKTFMMDLVAALRLRSQEAVNVRKRRGVTTTRAMQQQRTKHHQQKRN